MHKDLSITEARSRLISMPESLGREPGTVAVTRNGKPVLAILPWDLYESLEVTIEIMSDPRLMKQVRDGIADIKAKRLDPGARLSRSSVSESPHPAHLDGAADAGGDHRPPNQGADR